MAVNVIVTWLVCIEPQEDVLAVDPAGLGIEVPAHIAEWLKAVQRESPRAVILVTTERYHGMHPCTYDSFHGSLPQEEADLVMRAIASLPSAGLA